MYQKLCLVRGAYSEKTWKGLVCVGEKDSLQRNCYVICYKLLIVFSSLCPTQKGKSKKKTRTCCTTFQITIYLHSLCLCAFPGLLFQSLCHLPSGSMLPSTFNFSPIHHEYMRFKYFYVKKPVKIKPVF